MRRGRRWGRGRVVVEKMVVEKIVVEKMAKPRGRSFAEKSGPRSSTQDGTHGTRLLLSIRAASQGPLFKPSG